MSRKILVTAALPYANGPIHIGHLLEYIQADIWVRFQRLRGNQCLFLCADDTHGTAVMLSAEAAGITAEEFIEKVRESHIQDFTGFGIEFDHYGSTNSERNRNLCHEFWAALLRQNLVATKEITQLYDHEANLFLADRYVCGTCPICGLQNQYGDSCDNGHTYSATELLNPISAVSGTEPEIHIATHLFVKIEQYRNFLEDWSNNLQPEVANYLRGQFLGSTLQDWDVSRNAPYFGFQIPDHPGNFWYVWFDAPIGYLSTASEWCDLHAERLEDWWGESTEIHHFIGRDITYFHCLFWVSMLKAANYQLPSRIHVHGFLTVNGKKMSKSKGTYIAAATYLEHFDPSYLRYYFASKLTPKWNDFDLNLVDFEGKVNADLVGKIVNIASRTAKFISGHSLSETYPDDGGLFDSAARKSEDIAALYESGSYNEVAQEVLRLASEVNVFIEAKAPWTLKNDFHALRDVCTVSLNLFRQIVIYLAPVLPDLVRRMEELLNTSVTGWDDVKSPLLGTPVSQFKHMLARIERPTDSLLSVKR